MILFLCLLSRNPHMSEAMASAAMGTPTPTPMAASVEERELGDEHLIGLGLWFEPEPEPELELELGTELGTELGGTELEIALGLEPDLVLLLGELACPAAVSFDVVPFARPALPKIMLPSGTVKLLSPLGQVIPPLPSPTG
jgi:hypothetical protein